MYTSIEHREILVNTAEASCNGTRLSKQGGHSNGTRPSIGVAHHANLGVKIFVHKCVKIFVHKCVKSVRYKRSV